MYLLRLFRRKKNKRDEMIEREKTVAMITEIIAQLDRIRYTPEGSESNVRGSIDQCIGDLEWCRKELKLLLKLRDDDVEVDFYRRVRALLGDIADALNKMHFFYTYVDLMILPCVTLLREIVQDQGER